MKRYRHMREAYEPSSMGIQPEGEFVTYQDHLSEVARAQIKAIEHLRMNLQYAAWDGEGVRDLEFDVMMRVLDVMVQQLNNQTANSGESEKQNET